MEQPKDYTDSDEPEFDITNFRYAILLSVVLWVVIISLIAWWL
ncbi:MAG: hypothetical protein AB2754_15970 [Candidatus Thiodiazotropha endolucinida]